MADKDPAESGRRLHVTTLLVASRRALDNALAELGFAEDDDRIVEHDGRLAFLTCTHEDDCDDMYALITEVSERGETWELQSRIDTEAGRAIYQSFGRYRPVEAVDAAVEDEPEPETPETPVHDVETSEGLQALKRILKRISPNLVTARKLKDKGVTASEEFREVETIDITPRLLGAPELVGLFDDVPAEAEILPTTEPV